jgi:hypothetical protein
MGCIIGHDGQSMGMECIFLWVLRGSWGMLGTKDKGVFDLGFVGMGKETGIQEFLNSDLFSGRNGASDTYAERTRQQNMKWSLETRWGPGLGMGKYKELHKELHKRSDKYLDDWRRGYLSSETAVARC